MDTDRSGETVESKVAAAGSGTAGSGTTEISVFPAFRCKREVVERAVFQRDGHWVAGAEEEDKLRPRPVVGEYVVILTLEHAQITGKQMLRVQGGNEAEAEDMMIRAIIDHLMSLQRAAWIREFDHEQFSMLNRERGRLAEFLAAHYGEEVNPDSAGMRTIVEVAIRHLRRDRERWTARLGDWALKVAGKPRRTGWTKPADKGVDNG
jgi:hypothetical protein